MCGKVSTEVKEEDDFLANSVFARRARDHEGQKVGDDIPALSLFVVALLPPFLWSLQPRFWRRFKTAEYITPDVVEKRRKLYGKCTTVNDNDNFRLYHIPLWHRLLRLRVPSTPKGLSVCLNG